MTYATLDNRSTEEFEGFPLGSGDVVDRALGGVAAACTSGEVRCLGSDWDGGGDVSGKAGGEAGGAV